MHNLLSLWISHILIWGNCTVINSTISNDKQFTVTNILIWDFTLSLTFTFNLNAEIVNRFHQKRDKFHEKIKAT